MSSGQVHTKMEVSLHRSPFYSCESQGKMSHFSEVIQRATLWGKL